jgi:hypothetical protein
LWVNVALAISYGTFHEQDRHTYSTLRVRGAESIGEVHLDRGL